jgi:hypothetical protein
MAYRIFADAVLVLHVLFVGFVVVGLLVVLLGAFLHWSWVRNLWFRLIHLAAIAVVVLEAWSGVVCPLTTWEQQLREKSGQATYAGGFVAHWLHELLFFDAPNWVFTVCYTAFASLVLLSWLMVPPSSKRRQ